MLKDFVNNKKSNDLKVSVIIISLNFGNYIEKTINAILDQDYPNFEVIVVDGNSTDETVEVLKKFGNRIIWISEPDRGQGDGALKGMSMSSGDIITIQSADDLLYSESITKAVEAIKQNPDAAGIYGGYTYIDGNGRDITGEEIAEVIRRQLSKKNGYNKSVSSNKKYNYIQYLFKFYKKLERNKKMTRYSFKDLITRKIVLPTCSTFFKKDIFYRCNFRDLKRLLACPDYRLWLEMSLHAYFVPIQDNLCKCRKQLGGSNINPKNIEKLQQAYRTTAEWFFNNPEVPDKYKTRSIQRKLDLRILLVRATVWANVSYKKAIDEYLRIVKKNPDVIFYWPRYFKYFLWLVIKHYVINKRII